VLPFKFELRLQNPTHRSVLEASLAHCDRAPLIRNPILRSLFGNRALNIYESQIRRIACDEQLYPMFGNLELNPDVHVIAGKVDNIMLEAVLPFTLSRMPMRSVAHAVRKIHAAYDFYPGSLADPNDTTARRDHHHLVALMKLLSFSNQ